MYETRTHKLFLDPNMNISNNMKAAILLPLYVYPNQGAWDPLYEAYIGLRSDLGAQANDF